MLNPLHYDLHADIFTARKVMKAKCTIKLENRGTEPVNYINFLLNKGLKVTSIKVDNNPLSFVQSLRYFTDIRGIEVNYIKARLKSPLAPGSSTQITILYQGTIESYNNVFRYVKDNIGSDYTIIRLDSYSYPILGELELRKQISTIPSQRFSYNLEISVSRGLIVANVGKLVGVLEEDNRVLYRYMSKKPSWRIDIAVSRFKVETSRERDITIFALEEDFEHAKRILRKVERCLQFYETNFGPPPQWCGYTVIELPEGYGGQADVCGMLVARESFTNPSEIGGVYHELAHLWNVPSGEEVPSRFLDEGFASYFQLLAEKEFLGDEVFQKKIGSVRQRFLKLASRKPELFKIPVAEYGKHLVTDASYIVGAWILYVLHRIVGDKCFKKLVREFMCRHKDTPATLEDFKKTAVEVCGHYVGKFLDEWLFGTKATYHLIKETPLNKIVELYEKNLNNKS
ncbi:MAG TPA: hypothetical protein ENF55_05900 [Thermoprotei archaeon]|nr:hypothetical protein [Thermoprotei archaeon]